MKKSVPKNRSTIIVNASVMQDVVNIDAKVYSPVRGFLGKEDLLSVYSDMRLKNGSVWSLPIILSINEEDYNKIAGNTEAEIYEPLSGSRAVIDIDDIFIHNKNEHALKIYGTLDSGHPGVANILASGKYLVAGRPRNIVNKLARFKELNLSPQRTKEKFIEMGWKTIAAFQTRNIPHRGHEHIQKYALKITDGLFIQPIIGEKRDADFKDEYILSSYKILIDRYFDRQKALLGIFPARMRYAGPREAVFHALVRRNYGCTHFIVGRDHAGVGKYYAPNAAVKIFDNFTDQELGIKIIPTKEVVYDQKRKDYYFIDETEENDRISFSGTLVRSLLNEKKEVPSFLLRREVAEHLGLSKNTFVDKMYKDNNNKKGFVLWFTGLSAAGKTTIADKVYDHLAGQGHAVERLDGDVVREHLTRDLGFAPEDRDENIRRIGFVANLLARNGVIVVASFITPYERQRDHLRKNVHNYIEIFVDTPLHVCEQRDPKGLYKKARQGQIKSFTGIDDPFERPEKHHLSILTHEMGVDESVEQVILFLDQKFKAV